MRSIFPEQPPESPAGISRRDAVKQLAFFCGLALSASSLSALAGTFSKPTDMTRNRKTLLDEQQLALLRQVGELIIPTTDTPGAAAAGVHDFINHQLVYCFSPRDQQFHLNGLDRLASLARQEFGKDFINADTTQQIDFLTRMETAKAPFSQDDRNYFKQIKSLVIFGYYTSEIGASQELAYLAIPGGFKGNFKFKDVGKAWSLI